MKLTPDSSRIDSRFLYYYFRAPKTLDRLLSETQATGVPHINLGILKRFPVMLPPLAEQRRIAEVLDRAEALRAKRRAALAQLDSLTQSLFLDLFGDVAKNDRNWPSERMEDLMKIRRGGSPRPIENYLGGDINWIKIGDGTQGSDIYLERCEDKITRDGLKKTVFLKTGSLIFANCGVSLGFARILKIDGCIHDGWLSFEEIPETKLDKMFLLKALNSITEHFRQIAPAGTQPNLNTGLMKNFRMILPPITLQREFARRVTAVEALKTAQRASLAELDALFATLQHRAFRGEL
jgi:type I restriction enzyme S subunit